MSEDILKKILDNKKIKINNLKKEINIDSLAQKIDENNTFIDFKEKIINIFKGEDNDFSKAVCLNAAAGLIVIGKYTNFKDSYNEARNYILSGQTFNSLKLLQNA